MKALKDRKDNVIGDGTYHVEYHVVDLADYPQVDYRVDKSDTSESVYVKYSNAENGKSITARFSWHENNAVRFGDQLNGNIASKDEILFHLGLKTREFIPNTYLMIAKRMVKKSAMKYYEEADLTIQEMYALGAGADISAHTGKLAKGSNWLIEGTEITEHEETRTDHFGNKVRIGKYIYK
jgi:hypothetical protein